MLKLFLFVVPLGVDTFVVSAALGLEELPPRRRLRLSLLLSAFEMGMPLLGMLVGRGIGGAIGRFADYVAVAVLIGAGAWLLNEDESAQEERLARLTQGHGLAVLALGLSISLDELAIGFSIGLLHLSVWLAILLIGLQAFLAAQAGMSLGARLNTRLSETAEKVGAAVLFGLAALLLTERLA